MPLEPLTRAGSDPHETSRQRRGDLIIEGLHGRLVSTTLRTYRVEFVTGQTLPSHVYGICIGTALARGVHCPKKPTEKINPSTAQWLATGFHSCIRFCKRKKKKKNQLDISGIEPDTSRMLSERDKPSTPYALINIRRNYNIYVKGEFYSEQAGRFKGHHIHQPGQCQTTPNLSLAPFLSGDPFLLRLLLPRLRRSDQTGDSRWHSTDRRVSLREAERPNSNLVRTHYGLQSRLLYSLRL